MGSNLPNVYFFVTILQFICCCVVQLTVGNAVDEDEDDALVSGEKQK